jgi:hypothetical protein
MTMLVIRNAQMNALARALEQMRKEEFARRLRSELPDRASALEASALHDLVNQAYDNAKDIEIVDKEDIYRFIKLSFLPEETRKSPLIQSVLLRVLNNTTWPASQRIAFIERHVVDRRILS